MDEVSLMHVLAAIVAAIGGIYAIAVRNRFKVLEHDILAGSARVGATVQYARSIDRHGGRQSRAARQHADRMANKGVRRGPRGKWRPAFFVDFNPWPEAKGIEVILPAMQAGLGGREQEHQSRLAVIEAVRVYNQELDQIPGGTVAEYLWKFRRYSYRTTGGYSGGRPGRGRGHGRGAGADRAVDRGDRVGEGHDAVGARFANRGPPARRRTPALSELPSDHQQEDCE